MLLATLGAQQGAQRMGKDGFKITNEKLRQLKLNETSC